MKKQRSYKMNTKAAHKGPARGDVTTVAWHKSQEDAWPMERNVQDVRKKHPFPESL